MQTERKYDVFISHASEDKEEVARPLAAHLVQLGLKVWIDEAELLLGDSLRRKIEIGLSSSRFGLVILSKSFFSKEWPQKELDALVAREDGTAKVILPVWHNVSRADVAKHSVLLADKLAATTSSGLTHVAAAILRAVNPAQSDPKDALRELGTSPASTTLSGGLKSIDQLVVDFIDRVTQNQENQNDVDGLRTGFSNLDRLTGGLLQGELYAVAAPPGVGATTFCLNVVQYVATEESLPTLIFSPRLKSAEIIRRLVASVSRINRWSLASGRLSAEEWERLPDAVEHVHKAPIYVDDTHSLPVSAVIDGTLKLRTELGALGLVVVDGLDGLNIDKNSHAEHEAIERLWKLAREAECPIILSIPIARRSESLASKRPFFSDLPSADLLERIAAATIFLYRDDYYNYGSAVPGVMEVIVARNLGGPVGTILLAFSKASARLDNLEITSDEIAPPSDDA